MDCVCGQKAVYQGSGRSLCKTHFLDAVEKKVERTIKDFDLIKKGDNVCVAASGGKDSLVALFLVKKYADPLGIPVFALAVDEGIAGYREHTLSDLRTFCGHLKIPLHFVSFKENYGKTLDEIHEKALKQFGKKPCTVCGVFRRASLNRKARELGATKLVTGHNLDDESQSFLMNVLLGNMSHNASLGPITGLQEREGFIQRVKPLYFVTEKETRLYAFLKGFKIDFAECPNVHLSFRSKVRDWLNQMETEFPGTKNSVVNSFLSILPDLKSKYKGKREFRTCTKCGDPCSGEICNACRLEEQLA